MARMVRGPARHALSSVLAGACDLPHHKISRIVSVRDGPR